MKVVYILGLIMVVIGVGANVLSIVLEKKYKSKMLASSKKQ